MAFPHATLMATLVLATLATLPQPANAQMFKRILERAVEKVEQRMEQGVERGVDKAIDCVFTDATCIEKARGQGKQVVMTDKAGTPLAGATSPTARPGEGAWANFDFVTGNRTLFAEDFSSDRIGNFPRRLQFREGNMELVEWQGKSFLRSTSDGSFDIVLPEKLPERFTIEFDLSDPSFWPTFVYAVDPARDAEKHTRAFFAFNGDHGLVLGNYASGRKSSTKSTQGEGMVHVSIMGDGAYMKVFLNEQRVSNLPNADFPRTNRIRFDLPAATSIERPLLIGNIKIAAGGTSLYDALSADGLVSVQGILFDTNSDRIRPESTPTLTEIGSMLKQHGDLRLRIEGHTDNVGTAEANQALSERRAVAIRAYLISSHAINASRLESIGKGQSSPAQPNDTPEGRQNNRRVVLVKI